MPRNRDRDDACYHGKTPKHMLITLAERNWYKMLDSLFFRMEYYAQLQREEDIIIQLARKGPKIPWSKGRKSNPIDS